MRIHLVIVVLVCTLALPLHAVPSSAQIPLDAPIYEHMDLLYRLHGAPLPSASRPWSIDEARQLYNRFADDDSYPTLRASIDAIIGPNPVNQHQWFGDTAQITMEGYAHTNTAYNTPYDWIRSVDERKPLLRLSIDASFAKNIYIATSFDIGAAHVTEGYHSGEDADIGAIIVSTNPDAKHIVKERQFENHLVTNFFLPNPNYTLSDWPQQSQLSLGGAGWSLTGGRGAVKWGSGITGDMVVSSHITNHNHLAVSFYDERKKAQLLYIILPDSHFNDVEQRLFLGHRIEFMPAPWVRLSLTENVMFLGGSLLLEYLDPTYLYHNLYNRSHLNAIASVEADFSPLPSLSVHAQFVLDQFKLPNEGDSEANAMGFLVNTAYSWEGRRGYWTALAEVAFTDPVLYRRDMVDFLVARPLQNNSSLMLIDYLGYPYGSDSQIYHTQIEYLVPDLVTLAAGVTFHRQGAVTFYSTHSSTGANTDKPDLPGPSPSGNPITERLILSTRAQWQTPVKGLALSGALDWVGTRDYNKSTRKGTSHSGDLQFSLSLSKRF